MRLYVLIEREVVIKDNRSLRGGLGARKNAHLNAREEIN